MAESGSVLRSCPGKTGPWVRIPPSPQTKNLFFVCGEEQDNYLSCEWGLKPERCLERNWRERPRGRDLNPSRRKMVRGESESHPFRQQAGFLCI